MAFDPNLAAAFDLIHQVEVSYAGLMQGFGSPIGPEREPHLGGRLLYVGELDGQGRVLAIAGNIAGAASLAATADPVAQKQAVREGVVDFLVTSLDEALRILKNEIRKRETVAVCVGAAPSAVEREMLERGVLPDLLGSCERRPEVVSFLSLGARPVEPSTAGSRQVVVGFRVAVAPARWLPRLDSIALECLQPELAPAMGSARRWIRLAPRFMARLAKDVRLLRCDDDVAARLLHRVQERVESAEIAVAVEVQMSSEGQSQQLRFSPPGYERNAS